jgi:hypothetical protein
MKSDLETPMPAITMMADDAPTAAYVADDFIIGGLCAAPSSLYRRDVRPCRHLARRTPA